MKVIILVIIIYHGYGPSFSITKFEDKETCEAGKRAVITVLKENGYWRDNDTWAGSATIARCEEERK
jgi:hypothetical protein